MLYSEHETPHNVGSENPLTGEHGQLVVAHENPQSHATQNGNWIGQLVVAHENPQSYATQDGHWIAQLAAFLVGEIPHNHMPSCSNCQMHNGLAEKEDFMCITYYCPHCHALNRPKHLEGADFGSSTPNSEPMVAGDMSDATNQDGVCFPLDGFMGLPYMLGVYKRTLRS